MNKQVVIAGFIVAVGSVGSYQWLNFQANSPLISEGEASAQPSIEIQKEASETVYLPVVKDTSTASTSIKATHSSDVSVVTEKAPPKSALIDEAEAQAGKEALNDLLADMLPEGVTQEEREQALSQLPGVIDSTIQDLEMSLSEYESSGQEEDDFFTFAKAKLAHLRLLQAQLERMESHSSDH